MATPVEMPQLGTSVEECVLTRWLKREGDVIAAGDPIAEIETDKTTFEVSAPVAGRLLARFFDEGALVPVFTNLFVIGAPGERTEPFRPAAGGATRAAAATWGGRLHRQARIPLRWFAKRRRGGRSPSARARAGLPPRTTSILLRLRALVLAAGCWSTICAGPSKRALPRNHSGSRSQLRRCRTMGRPPDFAQRSRAGCASRWRPRPSTR